MKVKNNPFQLLKNIDKKVLTGKQKYPPFYNAIKLHPPAPKPLMAPTKTFNEPVHIERQIQLSQSTKKFHSKKLKFKLPEIIYKEDKIRRVFYEQHPFELTRPRLVLELNLPQDFQWTSIYGNEKTRIELCGEKALHEFYEAREKEEEKERVAQQLGEEIAKPFTDYFNEMERKNLKEGREYRESREL
ncbi:mitochondrial ribosomal small subunit component [Boothiomyces macroporosus]|uniref:Small ribosomal subunit protein mS23 n=1 Tax=Boothiomyces macroporosus TaxID=261099 RepID=A0AAD5UPL2_9FUNG|nr:mitochondrial ribosomal small subunit component [Boothiomyces macroporosus]